MKRYEFSDAERKALEKLRVPLAVYQFLNKRVVTVLVSDGFIELLGYDSREKTIYAMDNNMYEDTHPDDKSYIADAAVNFAVNGGKYNVVYRSRSLSGSDYRILHATGEHIYTEDGTRLAYVWYTDEGPYSSRSHDSLLAVDFDIRHALKDKNAEINSSYDVLTGLPTMSYFIDLVNQWRRDHRGGNGNTAIVYINLCGMKHYNRRFGFAEGDHLLRRFSGILERAFSQENCSRFGSDHFCVFTTTDRLEETLEHVFDEFRSDKAGPSLPVRAGIYPEIYGILGVSAECDRAKYACDVLQNIRISTFRYFEESMLSRAQKRHYYTDNLNRALEEGWIQVYYQPIIRAANRRVSDEEALARWIDPVRGVIPPDEFIPVLEESKLIYKLDLYVVEQVLKKIMIQKQEGLYVVPTSVNLSRSDFDACDMVEEIRSRVDAAGVNRSLLNIEVTESTVGKDFDYMKAQINRFRELGFHVWMDDFGNGYSALDMLQSIHFDLIKFDMYFMKEFSNGDKARILLTELIRMAISLGMDTICEGVETEEQVSFLQEVGCTMMQGYYFCRPIPMDAILERYRTGTQIGFENPDESDYYEAIGKINLYDLAILSNDDEEVFEHYFNTIPMAIIESTDEFFMLVRCNTTYRSLMMKLLGYFPIGRHVSFEEGDGVTNRGFLKAVRECGNKGSKMLIEDRLSDGTVLQAFLKNIAHNPVTGANAIVIAILTITHPDNTHSPVSFTHLARALTSDYLTLYYANIRTGRYVEYRGSDGFEEPEAERFGDDFFASVRRTVREQVAPEDIEPLLSALTKENILRSIEEMGSFVLFFRATVFGKMKPVNLKAVRIKHDRDHIILGLREKKELIESDLQTDALR